MVQPTTDQSVPPPSGRLPEPVTSFGPAWKVSHLVREPFDRFGLETGVARLLRRQPEPIVTIGNAAGALTS